MQGMEEKPKRTFWQNVFTLGNILPAIAFLGIFIGPEIVQDVHRGCMQSVRPYVASMLVPLLFMVSRQWLVAKYTQSTTKPWRPWSSRQIDAALTERNGDQQKDPKPVQFHLSTAIVLMFVAGLFLGLSIHNGGWPFLVFIADPVGKPFVKPDDVDVKCVVNDIYISYLALISAYCFCEFLIRRREPPVPRSKRRPMRL